MERFTDWYTDSYGKTRACLVSPTKYSICNKCEFQKECDNCSFAKAIRRLAEYEDLNMAADEIKQKLSK